MIEGGHRDDDQRTHSLLSFDQAEPGEGPAPGANDAVLRHRLARSRRQARPSPLLVALSGSAREDRNEPERVAEASASPSAPQPVSTGQQAAPSVAAAEPQAGAKPWSATDFLKRWLPGDTRAAPATAAAEPPLAKPSAAGDAPPKVAPETRRAAPSKPPGQAPAPAPRAPVQGQWGAQGGYSPVYVPHTYAPPYTPAYSQSTPAEKDAAWRPLIDPAKVFSGVWNSKKIIAATTIAGAMIGVFMALSTPKKYEAFAELLIDPRDLKLADRDLTQTGLPSDATLAIIENQVRVLTSGTVLTKVVDKLNLTADPEFNGTAGGVTGIRDLIGILRSLLSRRDAANAEEWRARALAIQNLGRALQVERGGKTFVVLIGAKSQDPEKSALIANTLIDVFFQTYGEFQSHTAGRAADELTSRLDELRQSVEEAEQKVETFKAENDIFDAQGRPITDDEILRLNEQLATARARTLELNARAQSALAVKVDNVVGGTLPEEMTSGAMTELRAQYARLKQDSDRLAVRLGPRHPERMAVEAQLAGARDQIAGELRRIVSATQTELRRAVQLEQDLAGRLAQIKVSQGRRNSKLVTLRELEREANARRAVYEGYLLRAREAGEARGVNTANMSIISAAYPPLDPLGPSRATIALAGLLGGFFAGIGIGAARGIYWSIRDNSERRRGEEDDTPDGPGGPRGVATDSARPSQLRDDAAAVRGWLARIMPNANRAEAEEEVVAAEAAPDPAPSPTEQELTADQPDNDEDEAMKPDPRYPGAVPPAGAYPYPYPAPGPYGHPMAQPYPPHPGAGYPMPWPPQATPYPYYPYPQQLHPGAYPAMPGYHQPAPMEPAHVSEPEPADDIADLTIEEIRATLREFRDAVRELAESRQRQRIA
jgi:uncharacterized protein involved in exopolysaccharide biosynthesis